MFYTTTKTITNHLIPLIRIHRGHVMKQQTILVALVAALSLVSTAVWAKPKIDVQVFSEKQIVETTNGKKVTKRVATDSVAPGNVLYFVLKYRNQGDEKATNVVINNPIPVGTQYVSGSATGHNSRISYSADNGKTFDVPQRLTYETKSANGKTVRKQIPASEYSHVKWVLAEIAPGGAGQLEFQVKVQ